MQRKMALKDWSVGKSGPGSILKLTIAIPKNAYKNVGFVVQRIVDMVKDELENQNDLTENLTEKSPEVRETCSSTISDGPIIDEKRLEEKEIQGGQSA